MDLDDTNDLIPGTCIDDNAGPCYLADINKTITDSDLIAGNIKSGINIFGITGSILPAPPSPPNCIADDTGLCFIDTALKSDLDTDLASSNIKSGVNIFGFTGTLTPGRTKSCMPDNFNSPISTCVPTMISNVKLDAACDAYCSGYSLSAVACDAPFFTGCQWLSFDFNTCTAGDFTTDGSVVGGGCREPFTSVGPGGEGEPDIFTDHGIHCLCGG